MGTARINGVSQTAKEREDNEMDFVEESALYKVGLRLIRMQKLYKITCFIQF